MSFNLLVLFYVLYFYVASTLFFLEGENVSTVDLSVLFDVQVFV